MKKIIYIIIGVIVIGGIILAITSGGNDESQFVTATAENGEVVQSVDVTGSVSSAEDIELNFRTTGRVSSMNIIEGDRVIAGQTLATLEAGVQVSQVKDAQGALIEAQANFDKVLAGSTVEDVRISEITVAQKKQALESAGNDLTNLKAKSKVELENLKSAAVVDLLNELVVGETTMEVVNNTLENKDAKDTLGVLDQTSLQRAKESQDEASQSVEDAKFLVASVTEQSSDVEVVAAIEIAKNTLSEVRSCLSLVFDVLENTIISNTLSQTELDALTSNIQAEQVKISTSKTSLQTSYSSWTNNQAYYTDLIIKAEDDVKAAGDTLELAEAQLNFKKAGPQSYEIDAVKAKVAKAEANLVLAQSRFSDTVIRAPVTGVVAKINSKKGEQTSLATPVIEMIGEAKLEIEVDIPESDISKVRVGQETEITLDSFGDDQVFMGSVIFVDAAETLISDVVYYEVKVQFNEEVDGIKPGMTANVVIKTEMRSDVLRVPLRAVKQKNGDKVISILNEGKEEEKIVTVGLRGDEYYEITSGLDGGEEVVTFVKNKK